MVWKNRVSGALSTYIRPRIMKLSITPLETVLHGPDWGLQGLLARMKLHTKAAGPHAAKHICAKLN